MEKPDDKADYIIKKILGYIFLIGGYLFICGHVIYSFACGGEIWLTIFFFMYIYYDLNHTCIKKYLPRKLIFTFYCLLPLTIILLFILRNQPFVKIFNDWIRDIMYNIIYFMLLI